MAARQRRSPAARLPTRALARGAAALGGLLLLALAACSAPSGGGTSAAGATSEGSASPAPTPAPRGAAIVVGSDLDNPPFAGLDGQGRPVGRDVEMMEAVGSALGRPIEWKRIGFDGLLVAAQYGLVDVVCATLGVSEERASRVAFTRPYFETVITVVVRTGPGEPRGWDDLDGRVVAAGAGTTAEAAVRRHLPRARLVTENKSGSTAPERLALGEVDGIAMDGPAADALVGASGGALTTLHTPLASERYALALPRDQADLLAAIDAALLELERNGQMGRWNGEYGLRPTSTPTR